ncbi:MAG: single-stranded-DNA-specific exonuclease RecJ, partial [Anaerolineae bacterium]|nr:single-stranded-DNA-specific exonuclease RecJ [Anaerolineae bacterium]
MTRWIDAPQVEISPELQQAVGGHPLVAATLVRRGISTAAAARAFLHPGAYNPASPADLPGLERAVERLRQAIDAREPVAVWGDFDADGQTATALLLEALWGLGAKAMFRVPTRQEGHGLHRLGLQRLVEAGARLIVTCDTGVTAHAEAAYVAELGADLIITDHHVPADDLPPALAVINPHLLPAGHALAHLTGVGVAYELALGLEPGLAEAALDLAALGTVADVGTLTGDNRYLVQRGMEALRTTGRLGLQALYDTAGLRPEGLTEEHLAFVLGPRLNALGRLADAADGVDLLTTADPLRARTLATELEGLNARRQWLTRQVTDAALAQVEREPGLLQEYQALVLSHPTWPGGVLGIVAGRLAERFGKPAVLIATPEGQPARGSGRSVPGVDLIAALRACAHLLDRFGGHAAAAGFSIDPERIPEIRPALSRAITAQVEAIPQRELIIDGYVELLELELDLVADFSRLAPFGRGNPALTLAVRDLKIIGEAPIGRMDEHRRVTVEDDQGNTQTVFWWQGAGWPLPQGRFDLALTLRANDYRGMPELQVEWIDAHEHQPAPVAVRPTPAIEIRDYRHEPQPHLLLRGLLSGAEIQVWAEGLELEEVETHTRKGLVPGSRLVLWTLPPGRKLYEEAVSRVQPKELIVFGQDAGLDEAPPFLNSLQGMLAFALNRREGWLDLDAAAARLGHRRATVEAGLRWFESGGHVRVLTRDDDRWQLARGTGQGDPQAVDQARLRLQALLAETAAYRDYLRSAPAAAF